MDECLEQQKPSEIAMVSLKNPYIYNIFGTGESTINFWLEVRKAVAGNQPTVTTLLSSNMAMRDPRTINGGFCQWEHHQWEIFCHTIFDSRTIASIADSCFGLVHSSSSIWVNM